MLRVTAKQRAVLEAVAREEVSWRRREGVHAPARTSYRQWTSENEYTLVTPAAQALVRKGLVKEEMAAGFSYIGRGPLVLTHAGRQLLAGVDA